MPFLPPPPSADGANVLVEAPRSAPKDSARDDGHGSHWLLWTTLAVVAVGGGVVGYLYLRPKDQPLPDATLGHYRF